MSLIKPTNSKPTNSKTTGWSTFRPAVINNNPGTKVSTRAETSIQMGKISMLVDDMLAKQKHEKESFVACNINNDDPFYKQGHSWEPSFEDDYSPYNSDNYEEDDGNDLVEDDY